jgi:2'-5' RNA ligase
MRFGIVLLPNSAITAALVQLAGELVGSHQTLHHVDASHPPHITIAQFECSEESTQTLWQDVSRRCASSMRIRSTGVKFKPEPKGSFYVPEGGVYFGIEVAKTKALLDLQRSVIACLPEDSTLLTGVEDFYDPHITLGVFSSEPTVDLRFRTAVADEFECSLALGSVGDYGTIPQVLSTR